jgi:hypothetical protein
VNTFLQKGIIHFLTPVKMLRADVGGIMKNALQKHGVNTGLMFWFSIAVLVFGLAVYFVWTGSGALIVTIGMAALAWSLFRQ